MSHKLLGNTKSKNMNHSGQSTTWKGWGHKGDKKEIAKAKKSDATTEKRRKVIDKKYAKHDYSKEIAENREENESEEKHYGPSNKW